MPSMKVYAYPNIPMGNQEQKGRRVMMALRAVTDYTRVEPVRILFRDNGHASSKGEDGQYRSDPFHFTISYKDQAMFDTQEHATIHVYVPNRNDLTTSKVTTAGKKPDNTPRSNDKVVWPDNEDELQYVGLFKFQPKPAPAAAGGDAGAA